MRIKLHRRAVVLALGALLVTQLGLGYAQAQKTIRVALTGPIVTLDPANYRNRNTENVIRNMFDGLYTVLPDGRTVPEIAEGVTQVDQFTWDFKIREGITFHNGEALTADDVAFTFNRVVKEGAMEGQTSPRKGLMASLQEVTVVDDYTARFHFAAPETELSVKSAAVFMQIMPKDYFEEVGVDGFIAHPVGAGPFKFVEASYAERVVLERYDGYWGGAPDMPGEPGPAKLDRVVFEIVPDPASRLAALRAGDIDIMQGVLADQVSVIENTPGVEVKTGPGTNLYFFGFNTELAPFDDPRVRRALAYAIDYDLLVEAVYGGRADALYGIPLSWNSEIQHDGLEPFTYDPERAKALLAEAGVTNLSFTIDTLGDNLLLAEAISQMLGEIGVDAQVRTWEAGALQEAVGQGSRQATVHLWGNASGDPQWPLWPVEPGYSYWRHDEFLQIMNTASDFADNDQRIAAFRRAYELVVEEVPYVTLVVPQTVEAARGNVLNFQPHPGGRVNMHRVDLATP